MRDYLKCKIHCKNSLYLKYLWYEELWLYWPSRTHERSYWVQEVSSPKFYLVILTIFCNGRKVPLIPSLLINAKLESHFGKKENHFNGFLHQSVSLNNGITLSHSLWNATIVELSSFQVNLSWNPIPLKNGYILAGEDIRKGLIFSLKSI